jgi:predicted RNA binding protein YcfA (HicA-like mRNA interferase family)
MRPKSLSGGDVVSALDRFGFEVVGVRGGHDKLRRTLPSGSRQTLTVPLHRSLAGGTIMAIYRQAARFVNEAALRPHFFRE